VSEEIRTLGAAVPVVVDLQDLAAVRRLAREALEVSGGYVAVLVNNAGGGTFAPTESTTDEQVRESLAVHVHAPFVLTGLLAPIMAERSAGAIVNVGSIGVQVAPAGLSLFHASKAALQSLTRSWTAEYGTRGVRINTVDPGLIITPPNEKFRDGYSSYLATLPVGRGAEPSEVANVIRFLVSPSANYIQGASVSVDGESPSSNRCSEPRLLARGGRSAAVSDRLGGGPDRVRGGRLCH
jgi:NAD(P)-dependent dehydrogenase (short-subunit alcohol dehydrogenase family)